MIKAIKKYGQNFLKNKKILENIVSFSGVEENDLIIEIGPGMGALTEYLVKKNSYLLCYEIDERMRNYLKKYENNKVKIIFDDFMKRDINKDVKSISYNKLYVIANIPYYITSPILLKLIESELNFDKIILLVQKEFAERLTAEHGHKEYNAFTLFVDFYYEAKIKFIVSKNDFIPVPNVDSAVIELIKKEENYVENKYFYFQFIKDAFKSKRKTLKNNLSNYDWSKIMNILNDLGYKENVRAEEISKENFKILVNEYNNKF